MNKIKKHFCENKTIYTSVSVGVVVAGITYLIMRDRHAVVGNAASDGPDVATMRSFSFNFLSRQNASGNVTTVMSREGRGHPGYITRWLEQKIDYETQGLAAQEHGVHPTVMSRHIQGILPDINGQHFERVGV
jgi:hypothetical protein